MSSLYTRSKEYTRSRKAQSDSPPSSPSPIAKTLRVSSLFLSVLAGDLPGPCSEQSPMVVVRWRPASVALGRRMGGRKLGRVPLQREALSKLQEPLRRGGSHLWL